MYEAVHARPDGDSTVARMAMTANHHGYDGIVVRNHGDDPASYDPAKVCETYDIDVVSAVEIRADDPSSAGGYVKRHRSETTIVCVHGGDPDINRFAVEQPAVDVLAHPMADDGDFNHVLARRAKEHDVRVELSLARVLRTSGGKRVRAISALQKLWGLLEHEDAPYVVSADPHSHLHVRSVRALQAVGEAIDLPAAVVRAGLDEWGVLAERNRHRHSDSFIEPGVTRVDEE